MLSSQAIRIRSGVAGLSNGNRPIRPTSSLADLIASLIAKKTDEPRNNGGSPIALNMQKTP